MADYYLNVPYISMNDYYRLIGLPPRPGYDTIYTNKKDRESATSNVSVGALFQDVISYGDWVDFNLQFRWYSGSSASAGVNYNSITGEAAYVSYYQSKSSGRTGRPSA